MLGNLDLQVKTTLKISFYKLSHLNSQQHYRYFTDEKAEAQRMSKGYTGISGRAGILPQVGLASEVAVCVFIAQPL